MSTPCYLSLDSNGGILTTIDNIVPTILRTILGTPGKTSDIYRNKLSFRELESKNGKDPATMCNTLSSLLTDTYLKYFPDRKIKTICEYKMIDEIRYNLSIDVVEFVTPTQTKGLISNRKVFIDPSNNKFEILYESNSKVVKVT